MEARSSTTRVWKDGRLQDANRGDAAMASLCQAVEKAVLANQAETGVCAVILLFDPPAEPVDAGEPVHTPLPVYVDVFDSGFSQDSGYGHGI